MLNSAGDAMETMNHRAAGVAQGIRATACRQGRIQQRQRVHAELIRADQKLIQKERLEAEILKGLAGGEPAPMTAHQIGFARWFAAATAFMRPVGANGANRHPQAGGRSRPPGAGWLYRAAQSRCRHSFPRCRRGDFLISLRKAPAWGIRATSRLVRRRAAALESQRIREAPDLLSGR